MTLGKSPQSDEETLLLCGFEVVFCDALTRLSEAVKGQVRVVTYPIQNLNTKLCILVVQTRDKNPTPRVSQNLSQGLDGLGFVDCASDTLP